MGLEYLPSILSSILLVLFITFFLFFRRQLMKKELKMKSLMDEKTALEKLLAEKEGKITYRLIVDEVPCYFRFKKINHKEPSLYKERKGLGFIRDLRYTEMKMSCEHDISVRKKIELEIDFQLEGHDFKLKGRLKKKEEYWGKDKLIYTIQLVDLHSQEQLSYYQFLLKKEVKANKMQKLENELN